MTTPNDGGPAFPFGQISELTGQPINGFFNAGMSLRDYFAAHICANLFSRMEWSVRGDFSQQVYDGVARQAWKFADALVKARDVKETEAKGDGVWLSKNHAETLYRRISPHVLAGDELPAYRSLAEQLASSPTPSNIIE